MSQNPPPPTNKRNDVKIISQNKRMKSYRFISLAKKQTNTFNHDQECQDEHFVDNRTKWVFWTGQLKIEVVSLFRRFLHDIFKQIELPDRI